MTDYHGGTAGEPGSGDPGRPPLADEARTLLTVVQEWAQRTLPEPPSGHGGPECQWCPLCQFASILRGEHPEVSERVAEAGTALAAALRSFIETAASHAPSAPGGGSGADAPVPRSPKPTPQRMRKPSPRVQHIQLDGEV